MPYYNKKNKSRKNVASGFNSGHEANAEYSLQYYGSSKGDIKFEEMVNGSKEPSLVAEKKPNSTEITWNSDW
ncbi:MAG: hypothetical protein Q8942_05175 [Bacillota bacterium]|nr:hypothetical protein [Bacillota bacterium]